MLLTIIAVIACIQVWAELSQSRWGLLASYYPNAGWSGEPALTRIDPYPHVKGKVRENALSAAQFSVKWKGWLTVKERGLYRFATSSDDGSTIHLNNELLVDNSGVHGLQKRSQSIELEAGLYPFEILYFQIGGYNVFEMFWTPPGGGEHAISPQFLFARKPSAVGVAYRSSIARIITLFPGLWYLLGLCACLFFIGRKLKTYAFLNLAYVSISIAFVLFLSVFCIQSFWKFLPESPLFGATAEVVPAPPFSLKSWFSQEFQQTTETWFSRHVGFRSFWVRTYNQINFSLFRQTPSVQTGTSIVLGKDNWLYTQEYLSEYAGYVSSPPKGQLRERIQTLHRLQDQLERHEIPFLLILSPSKAYVYPEYLPERYQTRGKERSYDLVTPLLDEYGIQYIDSYPFFAKIKSDAPYRLFPKGGIHWNDYGAFLIFRESIIRLNQTLKTSLPVPEYHSVTMASPRHPDNDLSQLLNIWTTQSIDELSPYLQLASVALPLEKQPKLLIIGDSFAWHLADLFSEQRLCTNVEVLYYYKRLVKYPDKTQQQFDGNKVDWNELLLEKDVVIIEINQAFLHSEIGFGFVPAALNALEASLNTGEHHASQNSQAHTMMSR